jgi:hypothetical protein
MVHGARGVCKHGGYSVACMQGTGTARVDKFCISCWHRERVFRGGGEVRDARGEGGQMRAGERQRAGGQPGWVTQLSGGSGGTRMKTCGG